MIKGIGVDIIEIDRVKSAVKKGGEKFLRRIYTSNEIKYSKLKKTFRFPELAARFAAKEAYSKAIGTGIVGISWNQIEIKNDKSGKPHLAVLGKIRENVHVSLSHSLNYAVAMVVIDEKK